MAKEPADVVGALHTALEAAGVPIDGVDSDGNVHFRNGATKAQKKKATGIVKNFDWDAAIAAADRREKYEALARLKAVKAEAEAAGDTEIAEQIQKDIEALN